MMRVFSTFFFAYLSILVFKCDWLVMFLYETYNRTLYI